MCRYILNILNVLKFLLQGRWRILTKVYLLGSNSEEKVKEVMAEAQK